MFCTTKKTFNLAGKRFYSYAIPYVIEKTVKIEYILTIYIE